MKTIITGGSSGIGLATAKLLANSGNEVYSFDTQQPLEKLSNITHIQTDITNGDSVRNSLSKVGTDLELLINNAGVIRRGDLFASDEDVFDLQFQVNVKGSWLMIKECRQYFAARPMIVQMSSGHALKPPKNPGVYTWTKQTLAILINDLRLHYPEFCVKGIYPGPVDTPMSSVDNNLKPDDDLDVEHHSPLYVAEKIMELIFSDNTDLLFDGKIWDYKLIKQ
jgi:NAD(P)-dependent dehydrogenase (short-subunit alcohol dehydrogenase family)